MASRSESKAEAAIQELKKTTGKEAIFLKVDLADLKSVKTAAEEFIRCVSIIFQIHTEDKILNQSVKAKRKNSMS